MFQKDFFFLVMYKFQRALTLTIVSVLMHSNLLFSQAINSVHNLALCQMDLKRVVIKCNFRCDYRSSEPLRLCCCL